MTLVEYRKELGWSQNELARRARLNANTVRKAENGDPISSQTALALSEAIGNALRQYILVRDIDGLNVAL